MKPLIGVVCAATQKEAPEGVRVLSQITTQYTDCIITAGGTPLLVPAGAAVNEYVKLADGWLIMGGNDIPASMYGEENHATAVLETETRMNQEQAVWRLADSSMPILGICFGCQFLNVMHGGSLIQDLPSEADKHNHHDGHLERFTLEPDSKLANILGTATPQGRSYHHQAIKAPGSRVKVVGHSEDGVIEAIEFESERWMFGVQWHPERTPELPESQNLFLSFIAAAQKFQEEKSVCGTW